ncbi:MAG: acyl-CoA dehydrogenase family protein [Gammaproteobacteria bacterium]|jgi:alkylation response protein AidB-like acyl-CoA dehydrogenase|nr:acyl-CoA dehydrogenase family protein [Gammaproteobacteria bacterium]MBP6051769.1 acyl-CoA dehydrogenase family protein [Pseudomonadales bacterium]MBK6583006.1 acyl-CoA dehydrogenase family protein [Gammaproteobacteria bacterium]MBK7168109.1 acyl-CoA dehydrogenase family protein [Gammaproteobacteria bacterium]MBK7519133.1 acyl-CoA dehydrogenase family protein [Gammaproteobacteria bacterium]
MSLVYNEDERMLQDAARSFLGERAPVAALRKLRDTRDPDGFSRELWASMVEMGWAGILVPEEYGGLGFAHAGAGILCEQAGRTLTNSPLFSTAILGATLLRLAGSDAQKKRLLPQIAAGKVLLALALDESARHDPAAIDLVAEPQGDGFVLNGAKRLVLDGHVADTLVVAARGAGAGDGVSLLLVDAHAVGVQIERTIMVDTRNAARIEFSAVKVPREALLGEWRGGATALAQALDVGHICLAAELLGIAEEAFARTLDYLRQRRQFGKLIGEFQALQHRAAILFCEIELCRSAVMRALRAIDEQHPRLAAFASLAKARACETATLAVNEAVQMHGGIGMTDEFDIGLFMKRAASARQIFGDAHFHTDRYATLAGY